MTIFRPALLPWPRTRRTTSLAVGELHLWLADHADWQDRDVQSDLSEEERARASRSRHAADRDRVRLSRHLLRHLLAGYLGTHPAAVTIESGAFGKPALAGDRGAETIEFNASGSAHLSIFAFSRGAAVGADIEAFSTTPGERGKAPPTPRDVRSIAGRFAADEAALVRGLPDDEATAAFLRLWTCKEACLKCRGTGLQTPLDEMRIELLDDTLAIGRLGAERFTIRSFAPVAGSIAAVAMAGDGMPAPRSCTLSD